MRTSFLTRDQLFVLPTQSGLCSRIVDAGSQFAGRSTLVDDVITTTKRSTGTEEYSRATNTEDSVQPRNDLLINPSDWPQVTPK